MLGYVRSRSSTSLLTDPDSTDEDAYLPYSSRRAIYFLLREPEWFEHRLFKRLVPNVNLHVFTVGLPEVDRMLLFRDHLRVDRLRRPVVRVHQGCAGPAGLANGAALRRREA